MSPSYNPQLTVAREELAEIVDIGVLRVLPDMTIASWNRWLERATDKPSASVVGRLLYEVFPKISPGASDAFARALKGSTVVLSHSLHRYLLPLKPPAGFDMFTQMQQSAKIVPMYAADGSVTAAMALITDVTERFAREEELRAALAAAQTANRAKSDFLASMSHELRTPIGAMWSYADLLLEGIFGEVPEEQRERIERIKAVGDHLLKIVEEILAFARIEAGREELHLDTVDIIAVARTAVSIIEPLADRQSLALRVDLPPEPVMATTDSVKVRQILVNLLGNAVKFTTEGWISLEGRVEGNQVVFLVEDTGRGITLDQRERIFEAFTQVSQGLAQRQPGTGLGLTVSRRLARMLGGDITLESEVGKGSRFRLVVPLSTKI